MVADGEFQLLYAIQLSGGDVPRNLADPLDQPRDRDARVGIIGVVSRSPDSSLGRFNGATRYNEWAFTPQTVYGKRAEGGSPLKGGPPPPGAN